MLTFTTRWQYDFHLHPNDTTFLKKINRLFSKNSQICYNHYKQKRFIVIKGGLYASDRTNVPPAIRG